LNLIIDRGKMKLHGKVAVITGVGSGIGRAITHLFAKEGAKIVGGEWNETTLEEVVKEVHSVGGEILGVETDISVQADAEALIDAALKLYDRVDILVNNAGVMDLNQGVGEMTDEIWQHVLGVNLNGPMYTSRLVIPLMVKQGGGSIINIASVAGLEGGAAGTAYTVSKHALVGLTKNTAWRYTLEGVRCNAIAAGGVETNITSSVDMSRMDGPGSARAQVYQKIIPAMLKPLDIANLALFLASDESKMINGAIIPADAGWMAG
jgi:NAD(P)-dependent dehydrogenase (short-subunit alcohol dehydrogenase family)